MTDFEIIADRIISAEGVNFAIAAAGGEKLEMRIARDDLKRAIVEALCNVFSNAVQSTAKFETIRGIE